MFRKYNSIENTYQNEFVEKIKEHGFADREYVVQEKAHGANMSFSTTDGKHFTAARRTEFLAPDEKFYNYQAVLEKNISKLQSLWKDVKQKYPKLHQLTVFGELIGGDYPHANVSKDKTATKVQKGIFYSPSNEFYAFDILLDNEIYLNTNLLEAYFEKYHLLHAKTLFRGKLNECLKYPNDIQSTIHLQLGLPTIEPNVAEGVVIRPVEPCFMNNGARVMLKNKNEKWAEKAKARKRQVVKDAPSNEVKYLQEEIMAYVTENRMNNVVSKVGEITPKDMGKVLGLFSADVLEDFMKDYGQQMNKLEKKDQKLVTKVINKKAVELVKGKM